MTDTTITVEIKDGDFWYDGEHYTRGDELDVDEGTVERHRNSFTVLDGPDESSETSAASEGPPADSTETATTGGDTESTEEAESEDGVDVDPHPSELTTDELEDRVEDVDDVEMLQAIRHLEVESKDRKGAKDAIDDRLDELEG